MFQTRDLVLFILVLFFLGTAITATLFKGNDTSNDVGIMVFAEPSYENGAVVTSTLLDRQANIDRLREKLAKSTERIEPALNTQVTEDELVVDEEGAVKLQRCLYPDDALSMVPKWPLTDVKVALKEGARLVYFEESNLVPISASTTASREVAVTITPLLQLSGSPQKLAESTCVPSEVVGVTSGGVLMFNGDVNSYRKIPQNALIGYARDGFPIYGVYEGEVDSCGGYDHPAGYRYTISAERDYIVGCYVGIPSLFSL